MERKNFAGWLLLGLLPLFAYVWMTVSQHHAAVVTGPVAVDQVTAELARSISYGFVDQPVEASHVSATDSAQRVHTLSVMTPQGTFSKSTGL